jgi:2'-5' RNA ligase
VEKKVQFPDYFISPTDWLAKSGHLAIERAGNACFIYIPFRPDSLVSLQTKILEELDMTLKPVKPDKFHMTLLYIENCPTESIAALVANLMPPIQMLIELTSLAVLEGGDSLALVWLANPGPALLRLQSDLYYQAVAEGLPVSEFSPPSVFKPHVTVAYDLDSVPAQLPTIEPFHISADLFIVGRNEFEKVFTVHLPRGMGDRVFVESGIVLEERAKHSRKKCMDCSKPPEVDVHWANGMARAWFCFKHFCIWAEGEDAKDEINRVWAILDGEAPKKMGEGDSEQAKKIGEKQSLKTIIKRLREALKERSSEEEVFEGVILSTEQLSTLLRGESIVYGPLRKVISLEDGPFALRHGDHEDQHGRPGKRGGSQTGFHHVGGSKEETSRRRQAARRRRTEAGQRKVIWGMDDKERLKQTRGLFNDFTEKTGIAPSFMLITDDIEDAGDSFIDSISGIVPEVETSPSTRLAALMKVNPILEEQVAGFMSNRETGEADDFNLLWINNESLEKWEKVNEDAGDWVITHEMGHWAHRRIIGAGNEGIEVPVIYRHIVEDLGYTGESVMSEYVADLTASYVLGTDAMGIKNTSRYIPMLQRNRDDRAKVIAALSGSEIEKSYIERAKEVVVAFAFPTMAGDDEFREIVRIDPDEIEEYEKAGTPVTVIEKGGMVVERGILASGESGQDQDIDIAGLDPGGSSRRQETGFKPTKKLFGKENHEPFSDINKTPNEQDAQKLADDLSQWPRGGSDLLNEALQWPDPEKLEQTRGDEEYRSEIRMQMQGELIQETLDLLYAQPDSYQDLSIEQSSLITFGNEGIEDLMRNVALKRLPVITEDEVDLRIDADIERASAGLVGYDHRFALNDLGEIVAFARMLPRSKVPRVDELINSIEEQKSGILRHYAPTHPGTGTGQEVHGGNGAGKGSEKKPSESIFHGTGAKAAQSIMESGLLLNFADEDNRVSDVVYAASDRRDALHFASRSSEENYALITIDSSLAGSEPEVSEFGELMFSQSIPAEAIVKIDVYRRGYQRKDDKLIKTIERVEDESSYLFIVADVNEAGEYSILGPGKDDDQSKDEDQDIERYNWLELQHLVAKESGKGFGAQMMAEAFQIAETGNQGLYLGFVDEAKDFFEAFDPIIDSDNRIAAWKPDQVQSMAERARKELLVERENLDEVDIGGQGIKKEGIDLEPKDGAFALLIDWDSVPREWLGKITRENPEFISPEDQKVRDARARGERRLRGQEQEFLSDVIGKKSIREEIGGLFARLSSIFRHGEGHKSQEGRLGQQGGSQPGYTHDGDKADSDKIGLTSETWQKQPFDEALSKSYADAIEKKFGLTPPENIVNAAWIAPDGRTLAEGSVHEETSQHALSEVSGVDTDDITISETQVIQSGLIRHTFFAYGQETFVISGTDEFTSEQKQTLRSMMDTRVDQRASVEIPSGRDNELVGLRIFVVEDIPPSLDPISRPLKQVNGVDTMRLLGLSRNEWRTSNIDKGLVVSTAPRMTELGELITESEPEESEEIIEKHLGPGPHPGTGTDQSVHAGNGANGDWNPEDDNTIEFGRKLALDEEFDEEDKARGVEFRNSSIEVLKEFYEKTGIKPRGLTITNSYLDMADAVIEGQRYPALNRYELAAYLADRSAGSGVVGSYENETIWMTDRLEGEKGVGGSKWKELAYHELGHWVHNDVLSDIRDANDVPQITMDLNSEMIGSDRYISAASQHYGEDTIRLRREYVADLFSSMVTQVSGEAPRFHRWGLGTFNKQETEDLATLRRSVDRAIEESPEISRAFTYKPSDDRRVIVLLPVGAGEMLVVNAEEAYRDNWPEGIEIIDPAFPIGENPVSVGRILDGAIERHGEGHEGQEGRKGQRGGSQAGYSHTGAAETKPEASKSPGVQATADEFNQAFTNAMEDNKRAAFVTHYSEKELADMEALYLSEDGKSGLAVLDHGDGRIEATAAFNDGAPKGTVLKMIEQSVRENEVNYAEAFGPFLPAYYSGIGFKTTEQYSFDEDEAPANWNYELHGRPDYHIMEVGK